jgi:hypothetical protein
VPPSDDGTGFVKAAGTGGLLAQVEGRTSAATIVDLYHLKFLTVTGDGHLRWLWEGPNTINLGS